MRVSILSELTSGVDAIYLSGRASLPSELLQRLETAHSLAVASGDGPPFQFGSEEMTLAPHGWGKYRYCLQHPYGRIGITLSSRLPSIRIQPYAEFLHGAGPQGVVDWFRSLLQEECGHVMLTVTRLDIFADFQGWNLAGDARHEFVCRAHDCHTYEDNGTFNGMVFGSRKSGSVMARLYDKTIESEKTGSAYWKMIWGDRYNPVLPVLRVEFELGRNLLRQYGLSTPEETLEAAGALWVSLTSSWLTHRTVGVDQTKSRWPISPEWECIQRARVAESAHGINRMFLGRRRGSIANIMPNLIGYLASFGAYAGKKTFAEMIPELAVFMDLNERDTGLTLTERIEDRRKKFGLP